MIGMKSATMASHVASHEGQGQRLRGGISSS
jgi:hypothetical protein